MSTIPRFKILFVATKSPLLFFTNSWQNRELQKATHVQSLPKNESMGSSAWKIWSTYLLATRRAPSATFKQQQQTTTNNNNMYTTYIIIYSSIFNLQELKVCMKMLQNNSSNLCYKSLDLLLLSLIHKTKFPLKVLPRKTFRNFCERGIPGWMYVCMYVCVQSSKATNGDMGIHVWQEKGAKNKKKPITASSWLHFILFILFI